MPSERFLKLDRDKQERIRKAAINEFFRSEFDEVSINRIVKEAGISRGSFYTYFDDKLDLLRFLIHGIGEKLLTEVIHLLDEGNGDIFYMVDRLYDEILFWNRERPDFKILRNLCQNMELVARVLQTGENESSVYASDRFRKMSESLYAHTDHERIRVAREDFVPFTEMILTPLIRDSMHSCVRPECTDTVRHALNVQMKYLKKGVYAKGKDKGGQA